MVKKLRAVRIKERDLEELARLAKKEDETVSFFNPGKPCESSSTKRKRNAKDAHNVLRLQAFKFALRPNGEQLRNLRQFAGSCRFVYNKGLALNLGRYEKKEQRLGYAGLCALLPNWKMEHQFLSRYQRKRCRTWNERTPTSFKNELTFRSSRRKASVRVPSSARLRGRQRERTSQSPEDGLDALPQVAGCAW